MYTLGVLISSSGLVDTADVEGESAREGEGEGEIMTLGGKEYVCEPTGPRDGASEENLFGQWDA